MFIQKTIGPVQQRFRQTKDDIERGTEFMGHGCEKPTLGLVGVLRLFSRLLQGLHCGVDGAGKSCSVLLRQARPPDRQIERS